MPEGREQVLAAQFDAIRRQFLAGLARRQQEIDGAPDHAALEAALHRLAGAAGGYGYPDLGHSARQALRAAQAVQATQSAKAKKAEKTQNAAQASTRARALALLRQEMARLSG